MVYGVWFMVYGMPIHTTYSDLWSCKKLGSSGAQLFQHLVGPSFTTYNMWYMQTTIMVGPKLYRFISLTVTVEYVVFLQQSAEFVMKVTSFLSKCITGLCTPFPLVFPLIT